MRIIVLFILEYFLSLVLFFLIGRGVFLLYNFNKTSGLDFNTIIWSFIYGSKMDASMAGYIMITPIICIILWRVFKKINFSKFIKAYTFLILTLCALILSFDLETFRAWDSRLDISPLIYLKSPNEAITTASSSPVFLLICIFVSIMIMGSFLFFRPLSKLNQIQPSKNPFRHSLFLMVLLSALIIPIRGGLGIAPINPGSVYFSKINYANLSAINVAWNFFQSCIKSGKSNHNQNQFMPYHEANILKNKLFDQNSLQDNWLNPSILKPNIILIIWESLTTKILNKKHQNIDIIPNFNRLCKEGLYFENNFGGGDRTDKGLVAILSGYPPQPTTSIIKESQKSRHLPILSKDFNANGYHSYFYYGGDPNFANMRSYLLQGQFSQIIDIFSYPNEIEKTKWGVSDEHTFNQLNLDKQNALKAPFFVSFLTLSSHEPFETPGHKVINGTDEIDIFYNSYNYTDKFLDKFVSDLKSKSLWDSTLVIIVGDHGHRLPETGKKLDNFKTPMLWLGGVLQKKGIYKEVSSQMDIAKTLLEQLNIASKNYIWSKNLSKPHEAWAYFCFNNGFGFVKKDTSYIYENISNKTSYQSGNLSKSILEKGKAIEQLSVQDYVNKK